MATVIPVNDFSPIFAGDTGNPFSIYVAQKNGFKSILGATITMVMQLTTNLATIQTASGPWVIDSNDNGKASYTYQTADVATPGSWYMWIKIVKGGLPVHVDDGSGTGTPIILVILPLPSGV